ncbi:hypothetical protein V8E55_004026 [Tylopilus felleus]
MFSTDPSLLILLFTTTTNVTVRRRVPPLDDHGNTCSFSLKSLFTRSSPPKKTKWTYSPISDLGDRFVKRADANANDVNSQHPCPETAFKECFAHDALTKFMESHGFTVTRH